MAPFARHHQPRKQACHSIVPLCARDPSRTGWEQLLLARAFRPGLAKSRQVKRHPDQPFRKAHSVATSRPENRRDARSK
ncbi:hypothetical protein ARTHRO8AJ_120039 [Arthrobacter sp. 8AJ]|nr:hypothetical protein ARTHRO8AJ_120039 [Arthrobacter sp. 8AJ]